MITFRTAALVTILFFAPTVGLADEASNPPASTELKAPGGLAGLMLLLCDKEGRDRVLGGNGEEYSQGFADAMCAATKSTSSAIR